MNLLFAGRLYAAVLAMLLAAPGFAAQQQAAEVLSLQQAVELGLEQNPSLAAARAGAEAVAQGVPQAGALADPRLSIGLANLPGGSLSLDKDPMSQLQIGFSQALPFPGKRALHEEAAQFRADAVLQGSDELRLQLLRDVKLAWWQLFYIDHARQAVESNRSLLQQLIETAQTLYSVGRGQQHDVLLAQLELARLDDEALRLKQLRIESVIALNSLLNRPVSTAVSLPADVDYDLPSSSFLEQQLQAEALAQHPALQASQARVEAARSQRQLSSKQQYPDFAVAATYGMRDGRDDLTSIQFSMSLPLYAGRKQSRAEDQRQAELIAAQQQLRQTELQVMTDVSLALSRYQRAQARFKLFETAILPQAQQTVEVMLAGYQVNKEVFANLIQAQTTLQNYQTQYWQVVTAAHQALAGLDAAVGKENINE